MEANNVPNVKFVPAVCPKCGGQLQVDPTQEAAVCQFCGTPFIVEKAIQQYTVQNAKIDHVDNVTVDLKGSVQSILDFAGKEMDKSREERRENKKFQMEKDKAFFGQAWKIFAVMFGVMIVIWVLGNALHLFQ